MEPKGRQEHTQEKQENECGKSAEPCNCKATHELLQATSKERDEWKEKYLKVAADLENFRRRVEKDQQSWAHLAQARILKDILPVFDDFERAQQAMKEDESSEWAQGLSLIYDAWQRVLKQYGIKEIDCSGLFDPTYHEAILQVDQPEKESGSIVYVIKKGYTFGDHIIRPAQVSVAK